jgi:signal transduction histidine kinase
VGRTGRIVGLVAAACALVTLATVTVPLLQFAYRSAATHSIVSTAAWVAALLAAFLIFGRLKRSARLNDLLLTCGLCLLALSSAVLALLPAFVSRDSRVFLDWDGRIYRVLGACLLAAAALSPRRRLERPQLANHLAFAAVASIALPTAVVLWLLRGRLPGIVLVAIVRPHWPDLDAPWSVLAISAITAVLLAVGSVGFVRRAERLGDEFFAWIAAASVLAAFSSFNYLLYPSRSTGWVYTGDAFQMLSCVVLLVGAMREIRSYWRAVPRVRVLEERRRIARDLHDGLAQEIAYIGRNLRALGPLDGEPGERLRGLRQATERAELESRRALASLSAPMDEPLDAMLARAVTDVADRFGAEVELDLASGASASPARMESLLRIACEAVANAARHSGASRVAVSLHRTANGLRLRVRDTGRGFDATTPTSGFGLISMRERARSVGGRLSVESTPGRGTTVEVAM